MFNNFLIKQANDNLEMSLCSLLSIYLFNIHVSFSLGGRLRHKKVAEIQSVALK